MTSFYAPQLASESNKLESTLVCDSYQLAAILAQVGKNHSCFSRGDIFSRIATMQNFALPWQKHGLLGFVLGGRPLLPTPMEQLRTTLARTSQTQEPQPMAASTDGGGSKDEAVEKRPRFEVVLKPKAMSAKRMKIYKEQDQPQRRSKLLEGWLEIVMREPSESQTGKLMVSPEEIPEDVLRLTLVDKATNTLAARLSSMTAYIAWMPNEA